MAATQLRALLRAGKRLSAILLTMSALTPAVAAEPQLPPIRGMGYPLVGPNGGLGQPGFKPVSQIISELKALGANTVRVTMTAGIYTSASANAADKALTASVQPSDADFIAYIKALKAAGIKVVLVPFANTDVDGNVLEGTVRTPTDINAFMADYTANAVRIARLGEQGGADVFVGFLDDMEGLARDQANAALFVNYITQLKAVFSGTVVVSPGASGRIFDGGGTHYELMPRALFDAVDAIGCTCYFNDELVPTDAADLKMMEAGFRGAYNRIDVAVFYEYLNRMYMKPVILTDTSYHSFDGASRRTNLIYDPSIPLTPDQQEQADLFGGHLNALKEHKNSDWLMGVTYSGQSALPPDAEVARFLAPLYGEIIGGKVAETTVRNWFTGVLPTGQSLTAASTSVTGGVGDDVITVTGTGARAIDGAGGTNTVVVNGNVADFTISGDFQAAQVTGAGLQLSLTSVHMLRFNNGVVKLPTGGVQMSTAGGIQTLTGSAQNDLIGAGPANQVIDPGTGNDIVVADPWYQNTLRIRSPRANAFYGRDGARWNITINAATRRWTSALGIAKIQFDDQEDILGGDTVAGTATQTHLYGSPANDTFTTARTGAVTIAGSAGNDTIEAGASTATVSYPVARAAVSFTTVGTQTTVTKPNGTDTLRGVKFLKFTDQTVTLLATGQGLRAGAVQSSAQTASMSLLRFHNTGASAGNVTAFLRDYQSGALLGQWTSPSIAAGAEVQYPLSVIESEIGTIAAKPAYYSVVLNSDMTGYAQHVLYRPSDGTLTNASTCSAGVTASPDAISGVHTSIVGGLGFPSSVVVNNTGATAASVTLGVYDARNGVRLGTYATAMIPANGQLILSVATIESGAGITPDIAMGHYVVKTETAFTGFLQHLVNNQKVGVITDMTSVCRLDGSAPAAVTGGVRVGAIFSTAQMASQSFLRFSNMGTVAGTAVVTLRDAGSGQVLGQWTSPSIPAGAQMQYPISRIEIESGTIIAPPSYYGLSVQAGFTGDFQHVLFRPGDGTLTNLSTCAAGVKSNATTMIGVHTSLVGALGFPSSIVVNNTGTAAGGATLAVYDALSGSRLGAYSVPAVQPGGQAIVQVSAIEAGAGITPTSSMGHYVIKLEGAFTGFLQHLVDNQAKAVTTDMSTVCGL